MMGFFDIEKIFFELGGYKMSHLEFWSTITGGLAVWLSAKENVWSWILGLINVSLAFMLFFQVQLYPDMFLQVFFFVTNLIGFYLWKYPSLANSNHINELKISVLTKAQLVISIISIVLGTLLLGIFSKNLHAFFPKIFSLPSAFPFIDSFTSIASIMATFMLMRKKLETWWLWLLIDVISTYMYFVKDIKLYSLLYFVFCIIAVQGALEWTKKYKTQ